MMRSGAALLAATKSTTETGHDGVPGSGAKTGQPTLGKPADISMGADSYASASAYYGNAPDIGVGVGRLTDRETVPGYWGI